jgi:predicted N-acetyltransferase YhbS
MKLDRENGNLRKSFNELAVKTFGLDFEDWYQNGYWKENYLPYVCVKNDKVIANVSVSPMEFNMAGKHVKLLQLGTVMTEESERNQGLIRKIMEQIEQDFQDKADGFFLFANDEVLKFYPKFGFQTAKEYQYSKAVQNTEKASAVMVPMNQTKQWKTLENIIEKSICQSSMEQENKMGLVMFYVTKFMQENVFYVESQNAYVIAEVDGETLNLQQVFAEQKVDLDKIIASFGEEIKNVVLGFSPLENNGWEMSELHEEDTTLFVKGKIFEEFDEFGFPALSHA